MFNICLEEYIWIWNWLIHPNQQKKCWGDHRGERSLTVCKVLSLVSCHFVVTPARYYSHCTNGEIGLKSLSGSWTQSKNTDLLFWFPVLWFVVFSNKTYIRAKVIPKLSFEGGTTIGPNLPAGTGLWVEIFWLLKLVRKKKKCLDCFCCFLLRKFTSQSHCRLMNLSSFFLEANMSEKSG